MSVLASCHLPNDSWTFDAQPESPSPDIQIGFASDHLPVQFENLSFGFTVSVNGLETSTKSYPPEGLRYIATDQQYITNDRITFSPDDEVVLEVWAENAGKRYEGQTTFTIPRPEQPYPSWTWANGYWQPPTPYPDDDVFYQWNEEQQAWVEVAE